MHKHLFFLFLVTHTDVRTTHLSTSANAVAVLSLSHSLPQSVTAPSLCLQSPLPHGAATAPKYSMMSPHTPASRAQSTAAIHVLGTAIVARGTATTLIRAACPTWHRIILCATTTQQHSRGPPQQPTTSLDTPAMQNRTVTAAMRTRMKRLVTIV